MGELKRILADILTQMREYPDAALLLLASTGVAAFIFSLLIRF